MSGSKNSVEVNGRQYNWPKRPVVAVCVDGSEPAYIEQAVVAGVMPWTKKVIESKGADLRADCVVPSFTNPNNLSIVTGVPPEVHGICGNFYYDQINNCEVMMNEPDLLRAPTIFSAFQDAGAKIAVITAKDKLRRLLGVGLQFGEGGAICFSSEKSDQVTMEENGVENVLDLVNLPVPDVYSADLSEFVFSAGVEIMKTERPDIMYLSTTDYVQHKYAPGSEGANRFYAMMDKYWAQLDDLGAIVALTADHGMNAKHHPQNGEPDILFLQDILDSQYGVESSRVILPITDPYVVHHGALGSFATIYLAESLDINGVQQFLQNLDGVQFAYSKQEGCEKYQLPTDRMGDLIVVSDTQKVFGTTPERHDLSGLEVPLRSHGGESEQVVPLIFSAPVDGVENSRRLRNFDIYEIAFNHVACTSA